MFSGSQLKFLVTMRDQASAQMKALGARLREVARHAAETRRALQEQAAAQRQAGLSAATAGDSYRRMGGSMSMARSAALGLVGAFATLAGAQGAAGAVSTMAEFGDRMAAVRAVTQATDDQFQTLRDTAISLGLKTRFTAAEAAEGLEQLARAGFTVDQSIAAVGATLDLAAAGQLGLADATDTMTALLSSFAMKATDAAKASDLLAFTDANSNTSVRELTEAFKYAGSSAAAFNVDIETTALTMGVLSERGIKASLAGTGFRRVLTLLNKDTPQWRAELDKLSLKFEDVTTHTNSFRDVLKKLSDAGLQNDPNAIFKIFGDRGGPTIINLLTNMRKYDDMQRRISMSTRQSANALDYLAEKGMRLGNRGRLTEFLNELTSVTGEMEKRLKSVGADMDLVKPGAGLMGSLEALRKVSSEKILEEFGAGGGRILNELIANIDDARAAIGNYQKDLDGFANRVALMMNDNLGGALRRLKASFDSLFLSMDQDQGGALRGFFEMLGMVIRYMATGEDSIEETRIAIEQFGWSVDATLNNVRAFANAIKFGLGLLAMGALFIAGAAAVGILGAALAVILTPFGAVAAAIAAAGAALIAFHGETITTQQGMTTWGDQASVMFDGLMKDVGAFATSVFNWMGIGGMVDSAMKQSEGGFTGWLRVVSRVLKLALLEIDYFIKSLQNAAGLLSPESWLGNEVDGAAFGNWRQQVEQMKFDKLWEAQEITEGRKDPAWIDEVDRAAVKRYQERADQFANAAEEAAVRAADGIDLLKRQADFQMAAGFKAAAEEARELAIEAMKLGKDVEQYSALATAAAKQGNAKLAEEMMKKAKTATQQIDQLAGKPLVTRDQVADEDGTGDTGDGDDVKRMNDERFAETLARTMATIKGRTAALNTDKQTQELWNAAATLGIDLTSRQVKGSREDIAVKQISAALGWERIAITQAQIRELGLETTATNAKMQLNQLEGRELAIANALHEERLRIAKEQNASDIQSVAIAPAVAAAIALKAGADYDAAGATSAVNRARNLQMEIDIERQKLAITRMSSFEQQVENALLQERIRLAQEKGITDLSLIQLTQDQINKIRELIGLQWQQSTEGTTAVQGLQAGWEEWSRRVSDVGGQLKNAMMQSLDSIAQAFGDFFAGQKVEWNQLLAQILRSIAQIISQILMMQAIKAASTAMGVPLFADGGVFGAPEMFAAGASFANTIVSRPTAFAFRKGSRGKVGIMGEAGPEGVLPLTKVNGKLGVHAQIEGGGGQSFVFAPQLSITMNEVSDKKNAQEQISEAARVFSGVMDQKFAEWQARLNRSRGRINGASN